jgi:signal peptidase I
MIFARYLVRGHSMEPALYDGDKLLCSSLFLSVRHNDIVVFRDGHREYVKRVVAAEGQDIVVRGDNQGHGRTWRLSAKQIKGKVLTTY